MKAGVRAVVLLMTIAIGLASTPGEATVVNSLPGGTIVPMPTLNSFGPGPQSFGPGITWTSTNATHQGGSVFGYTGGYGFLGNGSWDGLLGPMAGLNDSKDAYGVTDTMTFQLSTPVHGVGGFLNYVPGSSNPTTIAVYDSSNTLLESYNLIFNTGGGVDTGQFIGFLEPFADISYLTLTDNYIGLTDLTVTDLTVTAVPEPTTMLLLGSGLIGLAGLWRKKLFKK